MVVEPIEAGQPENAPGSYQSETISTGWRSRLDRWFMHKPLEVKTKIAVWAGLGGLAAVTAIGLIGLASSDYKTYFAVAIVFLACSFSAACLSAVMFLINRIIHPFVRMANDMETVSQGNQDIAVSETDRVDEIGTMARALEVFVTSQRRVAELSEQQLEASKQREADRQASVELRERELKRLATQFENTVGEVAQVVAAASKDLQNTASFMNSSASDAIVQIDSAGSAMNDALEGATVAASASDEFSLSIQEISSQAAGSAEFARDASSVAKNADKTIQDLSASAQEVAQVTDMIGNLAHRTNLLALNASIEAARSGEAGRGFAVVATEVKELATQSARATELVSEQIANMQRSTDDSISALRTIADKILQLETSATSIASAVNQQNNAGQDLAKSIDRAATASGRASSLLDNVSASSATSRRTATEVLESAQKLDAQSSTLRAQVDAFLTYIRASELR